MKFTLVYQIRIGCRAVFWIIFFLLHTLPRHPSALNSPLPASSPSKGFFRFGSSPLFFSTLTLLPYHRSAFTFELIPLTPTTNSFHMAESHTHNEIKMLPKFKHPKFETFRRQKATSRHPQHFFPLHNIFQTRITIKGHIASWHTSFENVGGERNIFDHSVYRLRTA